MYKLVIFDLDGTLLDTIGDLADSCNFALGKLGFPPHDTKEYCGFVGNGITKLIERALPAGERDENTVSAVRKYFVSHYSENNTVRTKPYPGIPELLEKLQSGGAQLAVASNKYQEATERIISHYFTGINFTAVFGQRNGIPIKPDAYVIREIMDIAGVSPEETIYVGDSGVDASTAAAVKGITHICVTWGFCCRTDLEKYGPLNFADKASDISDIYFKEGSI